MHPCTSRCEARFKETLKKCKLNNFREEKLVVTSNISANCPISCRDVTTGMLNMVGNLLILVLMNLSKVVCSFIYQNYAAIVICEL